MLTFIANFPRKAVAKEEQEATEAEQVIAEMDRKKQFKQEQRAHLLVQIEETKEAVQRKRESNQTRGQLSHRQATYCSAIIRDLC